MTSPSERVRFNRGFHDGAEDARQGRQALSAVLGNEQRDKAYSEGYNRGKDAVRRGISTESSDAAWKDSRADRTAKAEGRQAIIECARQRRRV